MVLKMKDKKKHLDEILIMEFISNNMSEEKSNELMNHVISCRKCREKLAFSAKVSSPSTKSEEEQLLGEIFPESTEDYAHQLLHSLKQYSNSQAKSTLQKFSDLVKVITKDFSSGFNLIYTRKRIFISSIVILIALVLFLINPIGKYMDYKVTALLRTGNALLTENLSPVYTMPLRPYGGFSWIEYDDYRGAEPDVIRDQENEIRAIFEKALEISKSNTKVLSQAGNFYLVSGNFTGARHLFERAMKLQPNNAIAANGLGIIYYAKNETNKAIEFFLLAKKSDPTFLEARYNLAFIYQKMEKYPQARREWREYLQMDSSSKWADNARDMLNKME